MSHIFQYSVGEAGEDPSTATTWNIDVTDTNNELVLDDVYIFALIGVYVNVQTGTTTPLDKMTTTIFAVQEPMEPLIDVSPYTAKIDKWLGILDPILSDWFYPSLILGGGVFGIIIPGMVTMGQLTMMAFAFHVWAGLIPINGPLTAAGVIYFSVLIWQLVVAIIGMNSAEGPDEGAEEEATEEAAA